LAIVSNPAATGTHAEHPPSSIEEVVMPPRAWSDKRERQYEHIKEGLEERGESEDKAEEIAARTVNKERARAGEAATASRTSLDDISSGRRGGLRSHRGAGGRTKEQLYNEAKHKGIKGRSKMNKRELERAVDR
jgi:plasmid stabilization system protein ParE